MAKKNAPENIAYCTIKQLTERRGDYGFDAPYVSISLGAAGICGLLLGALLRWVFQKPVPGTGFLVYGTFMLLSSAYYVYTTRRGKFLSWAQLLAELQLKGDEQVIDLGCGRGAVLLMAASLLPHRYS